MSTIFYKIQNNVDGKDEKFMIEMIEMKRKIDSELNWENSDLF